MELTSAEQVYHVTRICVDSYEKQVPTGWICNPYLEEAVPFHGVMQFLLRMEALLDQLNFPQSFTANRGMPDTLTTATPSHGMRGGGRGDLLPADPVPQERQLAGLPGLGQPGGAIPEHSGAAAPHGPGAGGDLRRPRPGLTGETIT